MSLFADIQHGWRIERRGVEDMNEYEVFNSRAMGDHKMHTI